MTTETNFPKLRLVDTQVVTYEGETYLLLRDPLLLTERTILIPQPMIPALALCDGTRSPPTLRAALAIRYGLFLSTQRIEEFLKALDEALLLDNDRMRRARAIAQAQFRQAPYRTPASAGLSYPKDPGELTRVLQKYLDQNSQNGNQQGCISDGTPLDGAIADGYIRGIISPHIDYERGGPVYAQVWSQAAEAVREAELAIIFGTDHFSEGHPITLTRQSYATPFGVLPTDTAIVDALADVLGVEEAYSGELHHRREHSIELAAVWMHHIRGGQPIQMVPILTGSLDSTGSAMESARLTAFLDVLSGAMQGRKAIVVAAGDLAHVGPAFDTEPVDPGKLILLKSADDELIQAMCQGDADGFHNAIRRVQDRNNVCGVSPIYLTLRLLAPLKGLSHGYAVCPADQANTSVVTICGVTLE
jgi:AmmeMemoRadiSam system protein B